MQTETSHVLTAACSAFLNLQPFSISRLAALTPVSLKRAPQTVAYIGVKSHQKGLSLLHNSCRITAGGGAVISVCSVGDTGIFMEFRSTRSSLSNDRIRSFAVAARMFLSLYVSLLRLNTSYCHDCRVFVDFMFRMKHTEDRYSSLALLPGKIQASAQPCQANKAC